MIKWTQRHCLVFNYSVRVNLTEYSKLSYRPSYWLLRRTVHSSASYSPRCRWTNGHMTYGQPISERVEMHIGLRIDSYNDCSKTVTKF